MEGFDPERPWTEQLTFWDFNVLDVKAVMQKGCPLEEVGMELIRAHDLVSKLQLSEPKLINFLRATEAKYDKTNTYHCSAHPTDVAVNVHFILESGLKRVFSPLEVLGLLVAAFGHDAGHFALNNAFLANSKHEIAVKFDFSSSLENFHLAALLEVLEDEDCNFLVTQSAEEVAEFKQLLRDLVLATDMAKHRDHYSAFQKWCDETLTEPSVRSAPAPLEVIGSENISKSDLRLLHLMCIKCADLANVVKPLSIADAWAERIMEEFYSQGEKEIELNLPLTQFPSREHSEWRLAKHQLSFLENVVHPLFVSFLNLAETQSRKLVIDHAKKNTAAWAERVSQLQPVDVAPDYR
jgi:hypothetical protein